MSTSTARQDWEARIGQQRAAESAEQVQVAAPAGLVAESGAGQVTLRWQPVEFACGYLVLRADTPDGPFEPVDHGGLDVLAVPGPWYCDTTAAPGPTYWYAVCALVAPDVTPGPRSHAVQATPSPASGGQVDVLVKAGQGLGRLPRPWHMLGSEHLSQLEYGVDAHGIDVGQEFGQALQIGRAELGAERVRAHGILLDELGTVREDGSFDFTGVGRIYDRVLGMGLRPVVEVGFMPRALASNPDATVFEYKAIISPPRDWAAWGELIRALALFLCERYGVTEVASWGFEVWNEPNLDVFWTGSQADYFRLYDETAAALKSVDPRLLVGGPSTAAAAWITALAAHVRDSGVALDFLSTHTYGNLPLDVGRGAAAYGVRAVPVWWTEWGVTPRHFADVNDLVFGAPFVLSGMASALERVPYLAYWVISDHFEELGRPPRLFHGGFGLLSVGNLRKPRFWALRLLQMLGPERLLVELSGDGGGSLVQAVATRDAHSGLHILVWNGTLDQSKREGDPRLARRIRMCVTGLESTRYRRQHWRIDVDHSNILNAWRAVDSPDWPTPAQWSALHAADRLDELEPTAELSASNGTLELEFELPMPGVSLIQLS